jgi:CubicO group peptidase (beta-lactamase class C family)
MDTGIPFGSADDFYRFVNGAKDEVVAPPGERFFYHNAAWRMLAHIIQVKTGMPVHEALKERVIDPLGMKRTTLSLTAFNADPDHILPHLNLGGSIQPAPFPYPNPDANPEFAFITGAGGVVSSVNEMMLYVEAMLGMGKNRYGRVLSDESMKTMQTLQISTGEGLHGNQGYGYGLFIVPDFLGHTKIGHGGSIFVSTANMDFVPDLNAGVVMMGNAEGMDYSTITEAVLAILMGKDPAEAVPAIVIRERTRRLTGSYETYRGVERVEVVSRGGLLVIEQYYPGVETPVTMTIVPEDPTLESTMFYLLSGGAKQPIEFVLRPDGGVDLFVGRYRYRKAG